MPLRRAPTPLPAVRVLMEETDPRRRAEAHVQLGERAAARNDPVAAEEHFREATELDPDDERPRRLLDGLRRARGRARGLWRLLRGDS